MKDLLLVGGGHTHVEIIRRWAEDPLPGWRLSVVSRDAHPIYSGMVPGFVAGLYRADEISIDLPSLGDRAGVRVVHDSVIAIDAARRCARLAAADAISYDLASIDIGSTVAARELPGVAQHTIASRPIATLIAAVDAAIARVQAAERAPFRIAVVGAGAAGVELCFCLRERLLREGVPVVDASIIDADGSVLPGASRSLAARVTRAMRERGIDLRLGRQVAAVEAEGVRLGDGAVIAADLVLWVTGAAALPLARDSKLPTDERGFIRIAPTFEIEGHPELFATGDCASLPGMQRAGVYAVRAGPLLDHNLRARMGGRALRLYRPQRDFLSLLTLGNGRAIAAKWGLSTEGAWVMRLKDRIDRGFVEKYH